MAILHQSLIDFRNALGYDYQDRGVCSLYVNMAVNAFLVRDLKSFNQRRDYIKRKMQEFEFLELLQKVRATSWGAVKKSGTQKEQNELPDLLDAMEFIDSGELYLNAHEYHSVFAKPLHQFQKTAISSFAQSIALEQQGGRALALTFVGIYTFGELKKYVKLLNQLAQDAQQDFALNLVSDKHDIALCYSYEGKSWQLIDTNYPDLLPIKSSSLSLEHQLAAQIRQSFEDKTHIAFQTEIWTTGSAAPTFKKPIKTYQEHREFRQLHDIASHAALSNIRETSLIHLAARSGEMETLRLCVEAKDKNGNYLVDLNKQDKDKVTAILMAAQNGHVDALKLLIEAKDKNGKHRVVLNTSRPDGETPVFMAAANGHVYALKLLNDSQRVDLNIATLNGATPVFIAARLGHKEVIIELLKNDVAIDLAMMDSVENLKHSVQSCNPAVIQRMKEFTQNDNDDEQILILPRNIAYIMGHDEIVSLLDRKKVVDQIQASIEDFENCMRGVEEKKIPSACRLYKILVKAKNEYKNKVYDCSPSELQELNNEFKKSCEEVQKTISDAGLATESRYGDAVNNVITAIINALNHLLSLPVKLLAWDSGYTFFNRKDYSSHEIRIAFNDLSQISQVTAVQGDLCHLKTQSAQIKFEQRPDIHLVTGFSPN